MLLAPCCRILRTGAADAQIQLPPHSREVLPNGVVLEVMQRKGVPLVDITSP